MLRWIVFELREHCGGNVARTTNRLVEEHACRSSKVFLNDAAERGRLQ